MATLSDKRVPSESRTAVPAALWVLPCTKRQGKRLYQSLNIPETMLRSMPWHLPELAWQCFDTVWVESLESFRNLTSRSWQCYAVLADKCCLEQAFSKENDSLCAVGLPIFCPNQWRSPGPKISKTGRWDFSGGSTSARWTTRLQNAPPSSMVQSKPLTDLNKKGPSRVIQTTSPARWWVEWKKKDWEETCTESPFPKATSTSLISFWHRISWSYTGCVVRPTLHYGIKFHKLLAFLNQRNDYIR